jgi:hypothetical protein
MTPEERRQIAFEVFDECLVNGMGVESALQRAAEESELKPDVFRQIAVKAFEDLASHREQVLLKHENAEKRREFLNKLNEYIERFHIGEPAERVPSAVDWVSEQLGRELTSDEEKIANDRHISSVTLHMKLDLAKILTSYDNA